MLRLVPACALTCAERGSISAPSTSDLHPASAARHPGRLPPSSATARRPTTSTDPVTPSGWGPDQPGWCASRRDWSTAEQGEGTRGSAARPPPRRREPTDREAGDLDV